jgi:hypothetical protein
MDLSLSQVRPGAPAHSGTDQTMNLTDASIVIDAPALFARTAYSGLSTSRRRAPENIRLSACGRRQPATALLKD